MIQYSLNGDVIVTTNLKRRISAMKPDEYEDFNCKKCGLLGARRIATQEEYCIVCKPRFTKKITAQEDFPSQIFFYDNGRTQQTPHENFISRFINFIKGN